PFIWRYGEEELGKIARQLGIINAPRYYKTRFLPACCLRGRAEPIHDLDFYFIEGLIQGYHNKQARALLNRKRRLHQRCIPVDRLSVATYKSNNRYFIRYIKRRCSHLRDSSHYVYARLRYSDYRIKNFLDI